MAMEVHGTLERDMDHFIKKYVCLFHDRQLGGHLSLFFCMQFFNKRVSVIFLACFSLYYRKKDFVGG
jgi:hypothetical protein